MKSYTEMLEEEISASDAFSKQNFGMKCGDGFPELVREIVKSDKVNAMLTVGLLMGSLGAKDFAESMKKESGKPNMGDAILNNTMCFDTQFSFLYWGIQIGRKMEQEAAKAMKGLEQ